jgi:hypothetical protein
MRGEADRDLEFGRRLERSEIGRLIREAVSGRPETNGASGRE